MQHGPTEHSAAHEPATLDESRRRARRGARALSGAAALAVLAASLTALATQGRGCAVRPLHGDTIRIDPARADVTLKFAGETDDAATGVVIKTGGLTANATGAATLSNLQTLHTITSLPPNSAGKKQFSVDLAVARTLWDGKDVAAFQLEERLPDGTTRPMATITSRGGLNVGHSLIGVAKLPDPAILPAQVNGSFTALPGQGANTFLSIAGTPTASDAYYAKFGPLSSFETLAQWKFLMGFPTGETVAYYRNEADLGFGRQMHCRVVEAEPAFGLVKKAGCYVTNFADENAASTNSNAAATVAMDFDSTRADKVRFVVYGADGRRINAISLDGGSAKAVPNLCLNCHGGKLQGDNTVLGAHFLPFDIAFLPTPADRGAQTDEFRRLNSLVWGVERNNPNGPNGINSIAELIEGWYGGTGKVFDPASTFNPTFVPPAWGESPGLYLEVVAPYCRTCHAAQRPEIAWNTRAQMFDPRFRPGIEARVCQSFPSTTTPAAFLMPHSQRTFQKFWLSGARAALAVDLGLGKCDFKALRQ
jgi:hypothetical protein